MGPVFKMGRRVNAANKFKAPKRYDIIENETWNSDIPSFQAKPVNKQAVEDEKFLRERQIHEENEIQKKRRRKSRGDTDYDNLPELEFKKKFAKLRRESLRRDGDTPKKADKSKTKAVLSFHQKKAKIDYTAILARCRVSSRTTSADGTDSDADADEDESAEFESCVDDGGTGTGTEIGGGNSASAAATTVSAISTGIGALNLRTTKTPVDECYDQTAEACSIIAGSRQTLKKGRSSKLAGRGRNLPSVVYNDESSLTFINLLCSTPFQKQVKKVFEEKKEEEEALLIPPPSAPVQSEPPIDHHCHVTPSSPSTTSTTTDRHVTQQGMGTTAPPPPPIDRHVTTPRTTATTRDHVTPRTIVPNDDEHDATPLAIIHITPTSDHVTHHTATSSDYASQPTTATIDHPVTRRTAATLIDHVTHLTTTSTDHVTQRMTTATSPADHVTSPTTTPLTNHVTQSMATPSADHVTSPTTAPPTDHVTQNTTAIKHFFETTHHEEVKKMGRKRPIDLYHTVLPSPELIVPNPENFTPGCRRSTRTRLKGFGKLQYERDAETNCQKVVAAEKMDVTDVGCYKRYGQLLKPTKYELRLRGLEKKNFVLKK